MYQVAKYNINNFNLGLSKKEYERCLINMNEKEKNNNDYFTDEDYLELAGTSSASDCTGLISQGSNETDSAKQYNDLYQFGIPHVAAKVTGESLEGTSTSASDKLSSKTSTNSSNKTLNQASNNSSNSASNKSTNNASNKSSDNASSQSSDNY